MCVKTLRPIFKPNGALGGKGHAYFIVTSPKGLFRNNDYLKILHYLFIDCSPFPIFS